MPQWRGPRARQLRPSARRTRWPRSPASATTRRSAPSTTATPSPASARVSDDYPSLETVIAARRDVLVAGWNYGYGETKHLTPESLADAKIAAYTLTESCRQQGGRAAASSTPWSGLPDDMTHLGSITEQEQHAEDVVADFDKRLDKVAAAPQAGKALRSSSSTPARRPSSPRAPTDVRPQGHVDRGLLRAPHPLTASQPDAFVFRR